MMSNGLKAADIKQWAGECGFDLVGITSAAPLDAADGIQNRLESGRHGPLSYLTRNIEQRLNVRRLVPGAQSVICLAMNYFHPAPPRPKQGDFGRVARYAWGCDYHGVMKNKLRQLAQCIRRAALQAHTRCFVDTAPLFEKALAARAGLGWVGKHGLLINERFGSWLVLGEIVIDQELEPDAPIADQCGSCTLCQQACPASALDEPYRLNAARCISCWTIEAREDIPAEIADCLGDRIFGCDTCQEVCPYNQKTPPSNHPEFIPRPDLVWLELQQLNALDEASFQQAFQDSPLLRPGLKGLQRNAKPLIKEP